MHHHHTDMFNGAEAGVRFAEYHRIPEDGPRPTPTRTATPTKPRPSKPSPAPSKTAPSKPRPSEPAKPTAIEQAKEAIKNGKIDSNEKSTVEKAPVRDAIKGERTRLQESVKKAEGADEHYRNEDGSVMVRDGKPLETGAGYYPDTDHERRVADLTENKDKRSLDAIDKQIKSLEDAGVTTGLDALKEDRRERAEQEQQVAAVIEEKESLVGALEAEKAELQGDAPKDAENDYQAIREDAQKWLDQFNANGGQSHEADLFGDDWDNEEGDISFDQLAEDLSDKDRLEDFAKVQGKDDGDGGDDEASMERHIADVASDDPEEASQIALRYQAAKELQGIFTRYNEAKDSSENNGERIAAIDAEIDIVNASIEEDRAALSTETIEALDEANQADTDIIEATPVTAPSKPRPTSPSGGDGGGKPNPSSPNGKPNPSSPNGKPNPSNPNGDGQGGPEGTEGGGEQPTTREVKIDYTKPENRDKVLTQAREQNLVPAENTNFNDKGEAVYTVQPNDSYWRISDMSDGKPPHEFDRQHFAQTVDVNSERFGRDPQSGLIHPNEQVVIPGRSIDELVVLMNLPTTEQVPVEEEPRPTGGGHPTAE